jgi:hypothetical protein
LKLLLKDKYLSGVSLIECNEIPIKHDIDYGCEITIQMNDKHDERNERIAKKIRNLRSDKYQSVDGKYCYLPPNTLIAHKKPTFFKFDLRN